MPSIHQLSRAFEVMSPPRSWVLRGHESQICKGPFETLDLNDTVRAPRGTCAPSQHTVWEFLTCRSKSLDRNSGYDVDAAWHLWPTSSWPSLALGPCTCAYYVHTMCTHTILRIFRRSACTAVTWTIAKRMAPISRQYSAARWGRVAHCPHVRAASGCCRLPGVLSHSASSQGRATMASKEVASGCNNVVTPFTGWMWCFNCEV